MTAPPHSEIDYNANQTPARIKSDDLAASMAADPAFNAARGRNDHGEMVFLLLEQYAAFFKLHRPREALRIENIQSDALGSVHVRLRQMLDQIPVWDKMVIAHFNKSGAFYLFQGDYIPSDQLLNVTSRPRITEPVAIERALTAASPGSSVQETALVVFVTESQGPRLAFRIVVAKGLMERNACFVDATDGRLLHKAPLIHH